jgi:methyl-accepting chemotaxis protein
MHLTIRRKLNLGFAAVLAFVAAVGVCGWYFSSRLSAEVDTIYQNNLKAAVHLANAQDALWRLRYGFPQFLVLTSPEDRKKITDEESNLYAVIDREVKAYAAGSRTPEEQAAISEWNEISQKYFASRPKWFELVAADKMKEAAEWRAAGPTPFGAGSVKALGKLIDLQRKVAEEKHREATAAAATATTLLGILVAVTLGLGAVVAIVIGRNVSVPLGFMVRRLAEFDGDLTQRLGIDRHDEVGAVARSFDEFLAKVHDIMVRVRGAAAYTTRAAHQLSTASRQLSSGAQNQASALEETAASLEEITGTVKQNADNARQANQLAVGARDVAEKGGQVVADAVQSMGEINHASKKIADIITTIDEIAFQTNLLALNAAVEAARAGEQGRGFAVVAAEVRNLAQRSAAAAKEITTLIDDSLGKVEAGSVLVTRSGETLAGIVASVKRVTDIIAEITASSQEQITGIDQVNRAVSQMDQVVQTNATQTEELATTAQSLNCRASDLQTLVSRFKLGDDAGPAERVVEAAAVPVRRAGAGPPGANAAEWDEPELVAVEPSGRRAGD